MRRLLALLTPIVFSVGCSNTTTFTRGEYGYGFPFAVGHAINAIHTGTKRNDLPRSNAPMDGHYTSIKVGVCKPVTKDLMLGAAVGPAVFIPEDMEEFYSIEITPRLTWAKWFAHPYIELLAGAGLTDRGKWRGQGTQWNFSLGGGVGVTVPLDEHWEVNVGYRLYHVSNGSKLFGSPEPNVGYNTDIIGLGLQYNF